MANSQGRRTYKSEYNYGSTARALDLRRELEDDRPVKSLSNATRKNRERAHHMSFGYVVFLAAAMLVCGYVLIGYINAQATLSAKTAEIARLETGLNNMKLQNDEQITRINASINLEEIKRIAIGELGMVYASEGQVVEYSCTGSDYVIQVADIPRSK